MIDIKASCTTSCIWGYVFSPPWVQQKKGSPLSPKVSHKCNVANQRLRDGGSPINYAT